MSIFHEYYLFSATRYLNKVAPCTTCLLSSLEEGYARLRSFGLETYDDNRKLQKCAADYGGWDKAAILAQVPDAWTGSSEDIAFWYVLLLYDELVPVESGPFGLGITWRAFKSHLESLGWQKKSADLIVFGHSLSELLSDNLGDGEVSKNEVLLR